MTPPSLFPARAGSFSLSFIVSRISSAISIKPQIVFSHLAFKSNNFCLAHLDACSEAPQQQQLWQAQHGEPDAGGFGWERAKTFRVTRKPSLLPGKAAVDNPSLPLFYPDTRINTTPNTTPDATFRR
jgi:hypothetical protein